MSAGQYQIFGSRTTGLEALGNANLQGKVAIVTGGSLGLGFQITKVLATGGAKVYMASLDLEQGQEAKSKLIKLDDIKGSIEVLQLDLRNHDSIHNFSKDFLRQEKRLDYLVLNAGIMCPPLRYTKHGLESQFAVNYFGHFVLTMDLLELMKQKEFQSRVVAASSTGHAWGGLDLNDINFKKGRHYWPFVSYGQSKGAMVLFAKEFAIRYKDYNILAYSYHPGVVMQTALIGSLFAIPFLDRILIYIIGILLVLLRPQTLKNPQQGAATAVFACVSKSIEDDSGAYLDDCQIAKPKLPQWESMDQAQKLWEVSEKIKQDIDTNQITKI